jgi:hypothetical protein
MPFDAKDVADAKVGLKYLQVGAIETCSTMEIQRVDVHVMLVATAP